MLETREQFEVRAPIERVWAYASDMRNWAANMPGFDSFESLSEADSRWTLKPRLGPFRRTVVMRVHVTEQQPPSRIGFTMESENDPVTGRGAFEAQALGPGSTGVTLSLRIDSSGPMAPMMESMARPVLPRMAKSFAESMARDIERNPGG